MSQELLYTSAPAGLKSGSRGFATVVHTAGTPTNLISRLETLSGYRHVFSPQDPQASLNPICWSHLRMTIGGQTTSILSRIAAYGVDYSGRTNKLAHHILVHPGESAAAGPAWVLRQRSLMRTAWDGVCDTPNFGPEIPSGNQPSAACTLWQRATGDAGWAGVVAAAINAPAAKPIWIVFGINQANQLLPLIDQAIALLPEAERWRATFITYYTNLPPEIDCRIRCVLAGTEEAKSAASRGAVIDLTKSLGRAADGPYVTLARTGPAASPRATGAFPLAPPLPPPSPTSPRPANDLSLLAEPDEAAWQQSLRLGPPTPASQSHALTTVGGPMPGLPGRPPRVTPPGLKSKSSRSRDAEPPSRRIGWLLSGTSGMVLLLLLLASIPLIVIVKKQSDLVVELSQPGSFGPKRNFSTAARTGPPAPPAAVMPEIQSASSPSTSTSTTSGSSTPTDDLTGEPTRTAPAANPAQAVPNVAIVPPPPEMPTQPPEVLTEAEKTAPANESPESPSEQQRTTDAESGASEEFISASLDAKVFFNDGKSKLILKLIFTHNFELPEDLSYRAFRVDNTLVREDQMNIEAGVSIPLDKECKLIIAPNASRPTEHDILLPAELQDFLLASTGMFNLKSFFGDANNRINNYQKSPPKHVADKLSTLNITGSLSLAAIEKMREKREEAEEIAGKIQKSIKEKASQPTQEKDLTQLSTINELTAHLSEANLTIAAQAIDALNGKEIDLGSIQLYRPKNGESELARRTTPVYKKVPLKFKVRIAN